MREFHQNFIRMRDIIRKDSNGNTRNLKHGAIKNNGRNNTFNRSIDRLDRAKESLKSPKIKHNKKRA